MSQPSKRDLSTDETWNAYMTTTLARFISLFPPEVQSSLDYSPKSLDVVEAWLFARYEDYDAVLFEEDKQLYPGAVLYIGETFRRNLGGHWVRYLLEDDLYFPHDDQTVIEGDFEDEVYSPHLDLREAFHAGYRDVFRENLEALMELQA
jgi:hypothetical protein